MYSTTLSTLLNRMDRYQTIATIEEKYKVADLDDALRVLNQTIKAPWTLKKTTIKIFNDVTTYPVASDHDELAFLDNPKENTFSNRPNFYYTSIQEFLANDNDRNDLCEIWENGTKYLGVRYETNNVGSQLIDTGKNVTNYTATDDASDITSDTVIWKENEGNNSIRFLNTVSSVVATIEASFNTVNDTNYKQKYFFVWMFLTGAPTTIDLKFGNNAANYLTTTVSTQFAGQAFSVNDWNLLAFDLNTATVNGVISPTTFTYYGIAMNNAPAGYYNIDNAYLRQWDLLDYWYYSIYNVKTLASAVPDRPYFIDDTTDTFSLDSSLVGDKEWANVLVYDAILTSLSDEKDGALYAVIEKKRGISWDKFAAKYPDMVPLITTTNYKFGTDYFTNQDQFRQ